MPDPAVDGLFFTCLDLIEKDEGGYADDPDDPGGATNVGITQTTYDTFRKSNGLPVQPVKQILDEEVTDIYFLDFWKSYGCDRLRPPMALCAFQAFVNMRPKTVKRIMDNCAGDWLVFLAGQKQEYLRLITVNPVLMKFKLGWFARVDRTRAAAGKLATQAAA